MTFFLYYAAAMALSWALAACGVTAAWMAVFMLLEIVKRVLSVRAV